MRERMGVLTAQEVRVVTVVSGSTGTETPCWAVAVAVLGLVCLVEQELMVAEQVEATRV